MPTQRRSGSDRREPTARRPAAKPTDTTGEADPAARSGTGKAARGGGRADPADRSGRSSPPSRATRSGRSSRAGHASRGSRDPRRAGTAGTLPVRPDEEPWSAAELAEVVAELDEDLARLAGELHVAESDLAELFAVGRSGGGDDEADVGTMTFEREQELTMAAHAQLMLEQVARARQRIADGSYGVCERCGQPIGKSRLQAFPRATLCVACKQREERR